MSGFDWEAVVKEVRNEWSTTKEIAERLGLEPRPGTHELKPIRDMLYALQLHGFVEQKPQHNGHLWRRSEAAEREDEPPQRQEAGR